MSESFTRFVRSAGFYGFLALLFVVPVAVAVAFSSTREPPPTRPPLNCEERLLHIRLAHQEHVEAARTYYRCVADGEGPFVCDDYGATLPQLTDASTSVEKAHHRFDRACTLRGGLPVPKERGGG